MFSALSPAMAQTSLLGKLFFEKLQKSTLTRMRSKKVKHLLR